MATLLLADVEGSTRLWETQPEEMRAALAQLNHTVSEVIAAYGGVRPVEQGEGDSFVAAFTRASDAVACAVQLQRAPLDPIRLRIGMHTGEVQLRDEGNYAGSTINRTARLRDLAHGGQTVLSGATEDMVVDRLPAGAWLADLGTHQLRDLPRPERVMQLCHPDLEREFPPLRTSKRVGVHHLPVQLTNFVGREAEIDDVRRLLVDNRLVVLTGAGGAGKTRLAVEIAARIAPEFGDGVWYVDLAPITHPAVVPVTVARALGLPDQPGRSTMDTLLRFVRDRPMLVVLDNCEHLLDAAAELVVALLGEAPGLAVLATSREPIGVAGEATWRVPSLSVNDAAIALFADRARLAQTGFAINSENSAAVAEICGRLDGMPLAIELAAARVRALSLAEILDGLHDRFRLLTGGSRTAVRRQQTLRASVDWSHALLTEPERVLFRRLAAFLAGFDLDAAQAVVGDGDVQRYQVLDQLTLLVDKSLVVTENSSGRTRYRMLETVRQYALEKLAESGEADVVRARHRDHYTAMAALLDAPARTDYERRVEQAEEEMDNLRAAFVWSLETGDVGRSLELATSLQPLWFSRGRIREGLAWFDAAFNGGNERHVDVPDAVRAGALADKAVLEAWVAAKFSLDQAEQALAIAREVEDPALVTRTLTACGAVAGYHDREVAQSYFTEAIGLARAIGDQWRLSQILALEAQGATIAGDPLAARAAAEEGRDLADAIGDGSNSRQCRFWLGLAQGANGDLAGADKQLSEVTAESAAAHDEIWRLSSVGSRGVILAYQGHAAGARAAAEATLEGGAEIGDVLVGMGYHVLTLAALAAGDGAGAQEAGEAAWKHISVAGEMGAMWRYWGGEAALAGGDLAVARCWADEAVSATRGIYLSWALTGRARVLMAEGQSRQAESDAHDALARAAENQARICVPDVLEILADLAGKSGRRPLAARLFGAAQGIRQRIGVVRFKIYDNGYQTSVSSLRDAMAQKDFDAAWAEGAALSTEEAIAYAQSVRRGRPGGTQVGC
jgi:predicted ATPase/class 3 adenylate cyclase